VLNPTESPFAGIGDENDLPATPTVQDAFAAVDLILRNRRAWTATIAEGTTSVDGDAVAADAVEKIKTQNRVNGGTYALREGDHVINSGTDFDTYPFVIGEEAAIDSHGRNYTEVAVGAALGAGVELYGHWERIYFKSDSTAVTDIWEIGGLAADAVSVGMFLSECSIASGHSGMRGAPRPWAIRDSLIVDQSGTDATPGAAASTVHGFNFITGRTNKTHPHGIIENCRFEGAPADVTNEGHCVQLGEIGETGVAGFFDSDSQPLTFRNCVFVSTQVGSSALKMITDSTSPNTVFENCVFKGFSGNTVPVVDLDQNSHVTFRDCTIFDEEGMALRVDRANVVLDNVKIISGTGGSAIANPQLVGIKGIATTSGLASKLNNVYIRVGTSAIRTGSVSNIPIIGIGDLLAGSSPAGSFMISNMEVHVGIGVTDFHTGPLLTFQSASSAVEPFSVHGLFIDMDDKFKDETGGGIIGDNVVEFRSFFADMQLSNINIVNVNMNGSDQTGNDSAVLYTQGCTIHGLRFKADAASAPAGTPLMDQLWKISSNVVVYGLNFENTLGARNIVGAPVRIQGDAKIIGGDIFGGSLETGANLILIETTGRDAILCDLKIERQQAGGIIELNAADNVSIQNCNIEGPDFAGFLIQADSSSSNVKFVGNTLTGLNSTPGVEVSLGGTGSLVDSNVFDQANTAIGNVVDNSASNSVTGDNVVNGPA
jgi:hypothetical protein